MKLVILAGQKAIVLSVLTWIALSASCGNHDAYEIHPDGRAEADGYFAKYSRGEVMYLRKARLLGRPVEVPIVADMRGAEYGFLLSPPELRTLFIAKAGEITVYMYNGSHLFVILKKPRVLSCDKIDYDERIQRDAAWWLEDCEVNKGASQ